MYHANVNANLMEESEIQIKIRIIVNVKASVRNIIYVRKIMFGILLHLVVKMVNILQILLTILSLRVMGLKRKQKQSQQILMRKK